MIVSELATDKDEISLEKNTEALVPGDVLMRGTFRGESGVHVACSQVSRLMQN